MGTSNFRSMEYDLPLIVGGIYDSEFIEQLKADYMTEYGEDEDAAEKMAYASAEIMAEDAYEDAQELAETFGDTLDCFKVEVIGGYYEGFQFYISGKYYDDYEDMDNDDAHDIFEMCRSKVLRLVRKELRSIERWLWKLSEEYGYTALGVTAHFSNGETWYGKVERPKRKRAAKVATMAAETIA